MWQYDAPLTHTNVGICGSGDCNFARHPYTIGLRRLIAGVERHRGRHGFDVGRETLGACRGTDHLVNPAVTLIVANDDNYALAA